jgi:hypothetical protein
MLAGRLFKFMMMIDDGDDHCWMSYRQGNFLLWDPRDAAVLIFHRLYYSLLSNLYQQLNVSFNKHTLQYLPQNFDTTVPLQLYTGITTIPGRISQRALCMKIKGSSESLYRKITLRLSYTTTELMETAYNFTTWHVVFCTLNIVCLCSEMSASWTSRILHCIFRSMGSRCLVLFCWVCDWWNGNEYCQ